MHILHQRCAALDVHKKSITACVLVWDDFDNLNWAHLIPGLRASIDRAIW
jgi:hypothetical protein